MRRFLNNSGAVGKLVSGWELSGIASASSGRPLNIVVDRSPSDLPDGNSNDQRPDLVPGVPACPANRTINNWLNETFLADGTPVSPFVVPAAGTWGNLGRNFGRGPGYYEIDTALEKETAITERLNLKFRVEAFNVFDHPIHGDPATDISNSASFGVITSPLNTGATGIGTPRRIQFMLRLEF